MGTKRTCKNGRIRSTPTLQELDMVRQVTDSEKETQPELVVSVDRKQALKEGALRPNVSPLSPMPPGGEWWPRPM